MNEGWVEGGGGKTKFGKLRLRWWLPFQVIKALRAPDRGRSSPTPGPRQSARDRVPLRKPSWSDFSFRANSAPPSSREVSKVSLAQMRCRCFSFQIGYCGAARRGSAPAAA